MRVIYEANQDAESVLVFALSVCLLFLLTCEMLASSRGSEGKGGGETCQDTDDSEVKLLSKYPSPGLLSACCDTGCCCCPGPFMLLCPHSTLRD